MRHVASLAALLVAIFGSYSPASAARLNAVKFEHDGKLVLTTYYSDNGHPPAAEVWQGLGASPNMADEEKATVAASPDDSLKARLTGNIVISIKNTGTRVQVNELKLVRDDATKQEWYLPAEELERTARMAGFVDNSPHEDSAAAPPAADPWAAKLLPPLAILFVVIALFAALRVGRRKPPQTAAVLAILLFGAQQALAADGATVTLQNVPIATGFRESAFGNNKEKAAETAVYKAAKSVGVDLYAENDPVAIVKLARGRLFHLFYNVAVADDPECTFMVQRIHKRVINYASLDDAQPETIDTYTVEGFKCVAGKMKRPDQHFGAYSIGKHAKRVIEKEFEIGIPIATYADNNGKWPYDPKTLYRQISDDKPNRQPYDEVQFKSVAKWTIRAELEAGGNYSVTSHELGIKIIRECPTP
jgi:hypothetical protein